MHFWQRCHPHTFAELVALVHLLQDFGTQLILDARQSLFALVDLLLQEFDVDLLVAKVRVGIVVLTEVLILAFVVPLQFPLHAGTE